MRISERWKKYLSGLLCVLMLLQNVPLMALAVTTDNLCGHHSEHTPDCGYVPAVSEVICTHVHGESCMTETTECIHTHGQDGCTYVPGTAAVFCGHVCSTEVCGYIAPSEGTSCACVPGEDGTMAHAEGCGYTAPNGGAVCGFSHEGCGCAAAVEATGECGHICSADNGCIKAAYVCGHTADSSCCYIPASPGQACHYECEACVQEETGPACDCGTDAASIHATTCTVYVRPENPECHCEEKCTEENVWCDICGFDYTACCGKDKAAAYEGETVEEPTPDMIDLLVEQYITEGKDHVAVNADGSWTISGNISLAPNCTFDYHALPYLQQNLAGTMPFTITLLDADYNRINLSTEWLNRATYPDGTHYVRTDSLASIYDRHTANNDWTNTGSTTICAVSIELSGSGTVTLNALRLSRENTTVGSADHSGEPVWTVSAEDDTKHELTYPCCGAAAKTEPHTWIFAASGAEITANCNLCRATASLTLTAPDTLFYDGAEKAVSVNGRIPGVTTPTVTYEGDRTNITEDGFTASITLGGATAALTRQIAAISITDATVTIDPGAALTYTGSEIRPSVNVTLNGKALTADNYDVSYSNNVNAGTAAVTVTGKGCYAGSKDTAFTIGKAEAPQIVFPSVENTIAYHQQLQEAKLSFYENEYGTFNWAAPIGVPDAIGQRDYALDFYPYEAALNNYDWTSCTWATHDATWIESRSALCTMGRVQVTQSDIADCVRIFWYRSEYNAETQNVTIINANNLGESYLKNGTDYILTYENVDASDELVNGLPFHAGSYRVTVTGKGNYTGSLNDIFIGYDESGTPTTKSVMEIYPATILVDEELLTANDKVYDGTTTATLSNLVISGIFSGDDVNVIATAAFENADAGTGKPVNVTFTLTGANSSDYAIYDLDESPHADITAIPIPVAANPIRKTYGDADPELTYTALLPQGVSLSGALARTAGEDVGTYAITVGTLSAGNNHTITLTGADLTIDRRDIAVTAADQTIVYGESISGSAITASGLVSGHSITATLTPGTEKVTTGSTITPSAAVVTAGGIDVTKNYNISYIPGKLVIEPDTSRIDDLTANNVTSANEEDIKAVLAMIADGDSAAKEQWAPVCAKCEALLQAIEETAAKKKAVTDKAAAFDAKTVNASDMAQLEQLAVEIEDLLDGENLTEEERAELEAVMKQVEDMRKIIRNTADRSEAALDTINNLDIRTVTHADEEAIREAIAAIDALLESDNLTDTERAALTEGRQDAEALLERIDDSLNALNTEAVYATLGTTPENVKLTDKADILEAISTIENALKTYGGNYSESDKKELQDQLDILKASLETIEKAEAMTSAITRLPVSVEPDDEKAAAAILSVKNDYDALTSHEKILVGQAAWKKLNNLLADLTDYRIIRGSGSKWNKGSSYDLTFTANGPYSKFAGIEVDGKKVYSIYYTAKSGSTIITLKQSFLKRLTPGSHTLTVLFTDGKASATFRILPQTASPATGDASGIILQCSVMGASIAALAVLLTVSKKRKKC